MNRPSLAQRLESHLGPGYQVTGELGHGGFGVVYLVGDKAQQRYLAVKVIRQELMASPAIVERFRREIGYASKLHHPNIVPVVFSADKNDLLYYAMPRARGKPLSKHLRQRGKLPLDESLNILRQVASGLAHAHARGVIHRDVKPANIMIEPTGQVSILDFGVAKALSTDGGTLTSSGQLLGSPEYMSPEQARNVKDLDQRTDIYSWGVVGYEMLAGRPPFTGKSVRHILHQHMTETPVGIRELRTDTPEHVAQVLKRCLEKDREKRWQTIEDAVRGLGGVVSDGERR